MRGGERGGRVLVTEDNPLHMKIFKLNLTFSGFSVLEAENGERGLELARSERPDLILVDLSLPKIDGWEMIGRMKDDVATRDIPVIVVSARRPQDEAARATLLHIDHRDEQAITRLAYSIGRTKAGPAHSLAPADRL